MTAPWYLERLAVENELAAKYAQEHESRIAALGEVEKLRVQRDDLQATLDHALREGRHTAAALVFAHERRDEALEEAERMREENAELRARIDELEGE
jgi:uncharacterized coiled-coil DUF342 family protein